MVTSIIVHIVHLSSFAKQKYIQNANVAMWPNMHVSKDNTCTFTKMISAGNIHYKENRGGHVSTCEQGMVIKIKCVHLHPSVHGLKAQKAQRLQKV